MLVVSLLYILTLFCFGLDQYLVHGLQYAESTILEIIGWTAAFICLLALIGYCIHANTETTTSDTPPEVPPTASVVLSGDPHKWLKKDEPSAYGYKM